MDIEEKIEYWLDLAEEDFITAEIVLKSKRFLHFGFLCHLTAEKLLKAYFLKKKSEEPPYIHNLLKLSERSGINELLNEKNKELLYKLAPLNIEARYPTNKAEISKHLSQDYCEQLYSELKEFFKWIKKLLTK